MTSILAKAIEITFFFGKSLCSTAWGTGSPLQEKVVANQLEARKAFQEVGKEEALGRDCRWDLDRIRVIDGSKSDSIELCTAWLVQQKNLD